MSSMKIFYKWLLSVSLVLCLLCFLPMLAHAQIDPECDPDIGCPIDGGLGFLLIAGVGYGIKKFRQVSKKEVPVQ